jgi:hypothetical protein
MRQSLVGLLILGLGAWAFAQEFHGNFDISVSLDPATGTLQDLAGTCELSGTWQHLTLGSVFDFEEMGLTWFLGTMGFDVGVAGLSADALFGAIDVAFLYGLVTGRLTLGGADFYFYYVMADPDVDGVFDQGALFRAVAFLPGGAKFESLTMFGADMEGISFTQLGVDKVYEFDVSPQAGSSGYLTFTGEKLTFTGLAFGCATLDTETLFTKAGFEHQLFSFTVDTASVLSFEVDILFTVQTKTVTITPIVDLSYGCVYVYTELEVQNQITITGLTVYGIKIVGKFGNTTVTELMSFDEVNHDLVLDPYWEQFTVEITQPACCGGSAVFRVDTYFEEGSSHIFDWGRTDFYLQVPVAAVFTLWSEMAIDPTGLVEWSIGCTFKW